jgi:dimethylhistidine N-methyltransferase
MDRFTLVETPIRDSFAEAVRVGLAARPRSIPPRFFYDAAGSELFDRICALPEYYVTRTEIAILERHAAELPSAGTVIEFGCGYGAKTRLLFDAFFRREKSIRYKPIDISKSALVVASERMLADYPGLTIDAFQSEYESAYERVRHPPGLVLFLGSNIGNFSHEEAVRFLSRLRGHRILVGFDMVKDAHVLHDAYDDAAGVTAAFNLNVLARINRELGGTFDLGQWKHVAFFDERASRVEMHLESRRVQEVRIEAIDATVRFDAGERIHTENSHKFTTEWIERIARESGHGVERVWRDERDWFHVVLLS